MAGSRMIKYFALLAGAISVAHGNTIYSGTLMVSFHDCAPALQANIGPLNGSCSSSNGSGESMADYTSMGVKGATNGYGTNWSSRAEVFDTLFVGGLASGTPVNLTFLMTYSGSYDFTSDGPNSYDDISTTVLLGVNDPLSGYIINDSFSRRLCDPSWISVSNNSCFDYGATVFGAVTRSLTSSTLSTTAGAGIPIWLTFNLSEVGNAHVSADFLDPLTLTNILVTDPNTGQPIAGATLTGLSGTVYPTNVGSVPEPTAFLLVATGCVILPVCRPRLRRMRESMRGLR